jgi:hypothetical protein
MIKKPPQLFLVIPADQLPRSPTPSLLTFDLSNPNRIGHSIKLPPITMRAKHRTNPDIARRRLPVCPASRPFP